MENEIKKYNHEYMVSTVVKTAIGTVSDFLVTFDSLVYTTKHHFGVDEKEAENIVNEALLFIKAKYDERKPPKEVLNALSENLKNGQ